MLFVKFDAFPGYEFVAGLHVPAFESILLNAQLVVCIAFPVGKMVMKSDAFMISILMCHCLHINP